MSRKDLAADLLRRGLPPSEIAQQMHTTTAAVMQYLCLKIGEGDLRRSDVVFSVPQELRKAVEGILDKNERLSAAAVTRLLHKRGMQANRVDTAVYIAFRRARVVLGDMYELVRNVELRLHSFIKQAFIAEFGEEQWWRGGVPDTIRAECAALMEKDPEPADEPFCYTHLINTREILDKRWAVLSKYMPQALTQKKKELMERLLRLNRIRNAVMHPVRDSKLEEDDFEFVRELDRDLTELRVSESHKHEPVAIAEELANAVEQESPHELVTTLTPTSDELPASNE
jgi:predicted transcriptional regulator